MKIAGGAQTRLTLCDQTDARGLNKLTILYLGYAYLSGSFDFLYK